MRYVLLFLTALVLLGAHSPSPGKFSQGGEELYYDHAGTSLLGGTPSDSCYLCHLKRVGEQNRESVLLCYGCHRSIEERSLKRYQHVDLVDEKYRLNSCEGCHRLHRAKAMPLLTEEELKLCYSCHWETKEYKSHPVVSFTNQLGREDAVVGDDGRVITCASHCHDVHGTDYKYLCRLEPGRELCISCHKEFR